MSAVLFWLMPKLTHENSVIVIDNAPYYTRLGKKISNTSYTKETIQELLIDNTLIFTSTISIKGNAYLNV